MARTSESNGTGGRLLTLQEAADRLSVHYMTAYRWVRKGDLAAFKAGGRLRVRLRDLERFVAEREVDVAIGGRPSRTDWPLHVDRLHGLLRHGEGVEAASAVRKVVADGAPAGQVYTALITPALYRIGDDWASGRITVAEEHRATEIVAAIMARLGEFFRRRGPSRGTAVTMTPPGEQHAIGALMGADFLRAAGYDVHHLGANVPIEDLGVFLGIAPPDAICVSVTNPELDPAVIAAICGVAKTAGAAVLVGGQGARRDEVEGAGGTYVGALEQLPGRIEELTRH